jgi:hippurate hydrolase
MNTHKIQLAHKSGKRILISDLAVGRASFTRLAILCTLIFAGCVRSVVAAETVDAKTWVRENLAPLVELYRDLHQHPELSLKEKETSARMAKELQALGIKVTTNVGGFGVVGVLENGKGKVVLLRSDTDGLPVTEQTGLPYASKVRTEDAHGATVGVMHACGHDVHMSNLIGVARYLASHRDRWSGTVLFVFQPAEEVGAGADAMIADGLFKRFPRPDFAVALHDSADVPTGEISYLPGFAMANVDSIDISMKGRGGHGASPETTIDPIVIAAKLVLDLQTIVSREMKPTSPAVVTVGSIHAGTKHNIISDECKLQLTVRSLSPEVRQQLHEAIRRKALAAAASAGAPDPTVEISEGTPALFNDPELTKRLAAVLKKEFGDDKVKETEPVMGAEDFGRFGSNGTPICMLRLGAVSQKRLDEFKEKRTPPNSLHSPLYYPDIEDTLAVGVPTLVACVEDLLPPTGNSKK